MMSSPLLDVLSAQQDYFWFLSGLVWSAVLVALWRAERPWFSTWLGWNGVAALLQSVTSLTMLVTPVKALPNVPLHPWGDWAMAVALVVQAAGWCWVLVGGEANRRIWRGALPVVVAGALLAVYAFFQGIGSYLPAVVLAGAALALAARVRDKPWEIFTLGLAVVAAVLSPVGPVASEMNLMQRWMELSPFGLFCALSLLAGGVAAVAAVFSQSFDVPEETRRQRRRYVIGIALWIVGGVGASLATSWAARNSFEQSAVARVAAAAALFDVGTLAGPLGPGFRFSRPITYYGQPSGGTTPVTYSEQVAKERVGAAMAQLRKIRDAHGDVRFVQIETLRIGWSMVAIVPQMPDVFSGLVTLLAPISARDFERWGSREAYFEGPVTLSYGEIVFARAPLVDRGGRMLGWLTFAFGVSDWSAAQAQARLLTFSIIALGAILGWVLFVQAMRTQEREVARQAAALAESANQLKTTFLASVSHELRTPIQGMLGYAELLQGQVQSEIGRSRIAALRQNGELMIRLVNDLIDLAALDSGQFGLTEKPVNLSRLTDDTVSSLNPRAERKGLRLTRFLDPRVPDYVGADPERLRQILINILGNAIKFTEQGGIEVQLLHRGEEAGRVCLEFVVTDTGPGISEEDRTHLFKPFSRLQKTAHREGSGLGLVLAAALCRRMGGGLLVESDGRSGSVFRAQWQLRRAAPPKERSSPEPGTSLVGRHILVADDNAFVRELFSAYLAELGAVCDLACDGLEALAQMRLQHYDALVLDLSMPGREGTEVARELRASGVRLRIVGVSAHAGNSEREEALAAGMDEFLTKPVDLATLAAALKIEARHVDPWVGLQGKWERDFRTVAAAEFAAIKDSIHAADWGRLGRQAHHLKNSATVLRDDDLYSAFDGLETAAAENNAEAVADRMPACEQALVPWLSAIEKDFSGNHAGKEQPNHPNEG